MKIPSFLLILLSLFLTGCDGGAAPNSSNANRATNVLATPPPPLATPANSMADSNTMPTKGPTKGPANGRTKGIPANAYKPANSAAPQATPQLPAAPAEKKDEGLFSFPPPKAVSVATISNEKLLNRDAPTTFNNVSEKLALGLRNAGYTSDNYSYFWNNNDEFAIVTAMERINEDGSKIEGEDRWDTTKQLPVARTFKEYRRYLINGKKVFYRVFAFIVTRRNYNFKANSPPSFEMARDWMNKGLPVLGGSDEPGSIQETPFTEKYHCYALLYLFVNHTSLTGPLAVNNLDDTQAYLLTGLDKGAETHIRATQIAFGEQK